MLRSFERKIFAHRSSRRAKKYWKYFKTETGPVGKKIRSKPYQSLYKAAQGRAFFTSWGQIILKQTATTAGICPDRWYIFPSLPGIGKTLLQNLLPFSPPLHSHRVAHCFQNGDKDSGNPDWKSVKRGEICNFLTQRLLHPVFAANTTDFVTIFCTDIFADFFPLGITL